MSDTTKCPGCSSPITPPTSPGTHRVQCAACETAFQVEVPTDPASPDSPGARINHVRVAARQQAMLIALLISLAFGTVVFIAMQTGQWQSRRSGPPPAFMAFMAGWLVSGAVCHIAFLMLSIELRVVGFWLAATALDALLIVAALGNALPVGAAGILTTMINVAIVLIVNGMATNALRAIGARVGLFGADSREVSAALVEGRTSTVRKAGLANAALLLSLLGLLFMPLEFLAIALGITALCQSRENAQQYGGRGRAITAIAISALAILITMVAAVALTRGS